MTTPIETRITPQQMASMEDWLGSRLESVEASLTTFREKRKRYREQMDDDFSWRGAGRLFNAEKDYGRNPWLRRDEDSNDLDVFDISNESLNIVGGFAEFMSARVVDDVFGTNPFFAASPESTAADDMLLADTIQKHSDWKLRQTSFTDAAIESINSALSLGEGVIKQNWERRIDTVERTVTVLVDGAGQPVRTPAGEMIFEDDKVVEMEVPDYGDPQFPQTQTGVKLNRYAQKAPDFDLSTVQGQFKQITVEEDVLVLNQVKATCMHTEAFLCPENVASLEEADLLGHVFESTVASVIETYQPSAEIRELLKAAADASSKTPEKQPEKSRNETGDSRTEDPSGLSNTVTLAEVYFSFVPYEDDKVRRLYAIYCKEINRILTVDYIANITPNGKLPFSVIRAIPVKNRWYGKGYPELLEKAQTFIDRTFNQINVRNAFIANPPGGYDPTALDDQGEDMEANFRLRPDKLMRLGPGKKMSDFISYTEIPDMDERTWQLMQFVLQVIQVRTGVTSAAQGEVSAMPSTATATGVESILQSASTLAKLPMRHIRQGLEHALHYAVTLIYANLDHDETFQYFNGDQVKTGILEYQQVKNLDINVRLLMTRFRQREMRDSAEMAIKDALAYLQVPEPEKGSVRPLFVQAIKGLGFDNADDVIRAPIQQPQMMPGAPGQLPQQQAVEPVEPISTDEPA